MDGTTALGKLHHKERYTLTHIDTIRSVRWYARGCLVHKNAYSKGSEYGLALRPKSVTSPGQWQHCLDGKNCT